MFNCHWVCWLCQCSEVGARRSRNLKYLSHLCAFNVPLQLTSKHSVPSSFCTVFLGMTYGKQGHTPLNGHCSDKEVLQILYLQEFPDDFHISIAINSHCTTDLDSYLQSPTSSFLSVCYVCYDALLWAETKHKYLSFHLLGL